MSSKQRASGSRNSLDKSGPTPTPRGAETQLFAEGLDILGGMMGRTPKTNRGFDASMRAPGFANTARKAVVEPQLASQQFSNTGIPVDDGFAGLSQIGGQNDWSISQEQEEESLPPARYNVSPVQPALSPSDDIIPGISENGATSMAALASPSPAERRRITSIESPEQPSQTRTTRGRGRGRSAQPTVSHQIPRHLTLPPLNIGSSSAAKSPHRRRTTRHLPVGGTRGRTSGPALIEGLLPDQALPETPNMSQDGDNSSRASRREGSYDPEDNRITWTHQPKPGEDLRRDRSRELSGPTFTPSRHTVRRRRSDSSESEDGSKSFSVERMLRDPSEQGGSIAVSGVSDANYGGYITSGEDIPLGQDRARARVLVSNSSSGTNLGYSGVPGLDVLPSSNTASRNQISDEASGSRKAKQPYPRVSQRGMALPSHGSWESPATEGDASINSRTYPPNQEALRRKRGDASSSVVGRDHAINDMSPDRRNYLERLGFSRDTAGDVDVSGRSSEFPDQARRGGNISANASISTSELDPVYKSQLYGMEFAREAFEEEERAKAEAINRRLFRTPPRYRSQEVEDEDGNGANTPRPSGKVSHKIYTPAKPYVAPPFFTRDTTGLHGTAARDDTPDNAYIAGDSGIDDAADAAQPDGLRSPKKKGALHLSSLPEEEEEEVIPGSQNGDDDDEVIPETQPSGDFRPSSPFERATGNSQAPPEPRVLVPATASNASEVVGRSSPVDREEEYGHSSVKYPFGEFSQFEASQGDNGLGSPSRMASFVAPSIAEEESYGFSGIGGQNELRESPELPLPSTTRPPESFELPPPPAPVSNRLLEDGRKRKRNTRDEGPEEDTSPKKKPRHISPSPPRPRRKLPAKTPARTVLSPIIQSLVSASASSAPASQGPVQTPPRQAARAIFSSSPLSHRSDSDIEEVTTPTSRRKGGASAKKSARGRPLTSGVTRANPDAMASQDPFRILAQTSSSPATGRIQTRSQSQRGREESEIPRPSTQEKPSHKRTRQDSTLEDEALDEEVFPPRSLHAKQARTQLGRTNASAPRRTRARTAASTSQSTLTGQPVNRTNYVFALHGKHYRPAVVTETWDQSAKSGSSKGKRKETVTTMCRMKFEDDAEVEAPLNLLYRCELREGDELLIPGKKGGKFGRKGRVVTVESWADDGRVSVQPELTSKKGMRVFESMDIAVSPDTVWREWEERKITDIDDIHKEESPLEDDGEVDIEPRTKGRKPRPTTSIDDVYPTQSKGAPRGSMGPPMTSQDERPRKRIRLLPSTTTSSTSNKPLAGCAFIVALSITDEKGNRVSDASRNAGKAGLQKRIKQLGGRVIEDDFAGLIRYGGSFSDDGNRWIWNSGDLEFVDHTSTGKKRKGKASSSSRKQSPEALFLIADRTNRTVKYMTALATGIPCIHKSWIESGAVLDWSSYLLPAGDCHLLDMLCSQLIRYDWMQHPTSFQEVVESPEGTRKSLQGKSILFIYPSQKGSSIEEDGFDNQYVFPCLASLMGATRVEVVHDRKNASLSIKKYGVIVYENGHLPTRPPSGSDSSLTVESNWISDCVISGSFINYSESS